MTSGHVARGTVRKNAASVVVKKAPILLASPVDTSAAPIGSMPAISTTTRHSIARYDSSMLMQPASTSAAAR